MAFDRHIPLISRSNAIREFDKRQQEINEHFWSFKVFAENAKFIARKAANEDPETRTAALFQASGPDVSRIPTTVTDWLSASNALENWLRLAALVSAAAYHEAYLSRIVRTALMSDPLCRFGARRSLDGTRLLKQDVEISYKVEQESITRGKWNEREAAFRRVFGSVETTTMFPIAELEKIRSLRNSFSHGFGRSLDVPAPSDLKDRVSGRISQRRFICYLGLLSRSATAVDRYLMPEFIGSFELIHLYHFWRKQNPEATPRDLKKHLIQAGFPTADVSYCRGLIAHYEQI